MAYAMTKCGSLDNCVTYEFICDTIEDMNAIENRYRTIGSIAIVLQGTSGLEVYISGSDKQWNSLSSIGGSAADSAAGLSIHICGQNEVSNGLPNISEPDETSIYLVPAADASSGNLYDEYVYVESNWEKFGGGGSNIDLSGYAPKASPVFTGSISLGRSSQSTIGANSIAEGYAIIASGDYSHAEGYNTAASGNYSHAEGDRAVASGLSSHAEGSGTVASAWVSHAEGYDTTASGESSHSEGSATTASGNFSHAEGGSSQSKGVYSHAEGAETIATGSLSHAEGCGGTFTLNNVSYTSEAKGTADHVEGYQCLTASNQPGNHAEGYQTRATGGAAHAEGGNTLASGIQAHSEGGRTTASGSQSHAEGFQTIASGSQSHSEGFNTTASGNQAHAEGVSNTASGLNSHAEGGGNTAAGAFSHVGGMWSLADSYDNWPEWIAETSYSIGDKVKITTGSTVNGYICKTANNDSSFISSNWINQYGQMNYAEIVGNGTANSARSNARALDWDGNEHLMGDIYVGCNPNSTGGTKLARIPDPPTTNGTYTLQATVSNGIITYSWIVGA